MVEEFTEEVKPNIKSPWNDALLNTDDDCTQLSKEKLDTSHALTSKGIFLVKRDRTDLDPGFALLSTWVRALTQ